MKEILDTTLIESDKSAFLIELVKHESGKFYINITKTIINSNPIEKQELKINQNIAEQIIKVLNQYKNLKTKPIVKIGKFKDKDQIEIQKRYLKGLKIADLAIQFGCTVNEIEKLLIAQGNEIISYELPTKKKFFRRR